MSLAVKTCQLHPGVPGASIPTVRRRKRLHRGRDAASGHSGLRSCFTNIASPDAYAGRGVYYLWHIYFFSISLALQRMRHSLGTGIFTFMM